MTRFELCPGRWVGEGHPVFVIAEIGQNHQGNLDMAKEMITAAKAAGADCVKFQKSSLKDKFTQSVLSRPYPGPASWGKTYGEHKEYLEFSHDDYVELQRHARAVGVFFTASAMDKVSASFLESIQVPFLKVGSGDANNTLMLKALAERKQLNLVVSTGMSSMESVRHIYNIIKEVREDEMKLALLQCTSAYPTSSEDANLKVLQTYRQVFPDVVLGYSGHEEGFVATLGAVALGAKVVERHVTLDKSLKGSDHCCSLTMSELEAMIKAMRTMELCLGSPEKRFLASEGPCWEKLGKSVVAAHSLEKGSVLTEQDISIKVLDLLT